MSQDHRALVNELARHLREIYRLLNGMDLNGYLSIFDEEYGRLFWERIDRLENDVVADGLIEKLDRLAQKQTKNVRYELEWQEIHKRLLDAGCKQVVLERRYNKPTRLYGQRLTENQYKALHLPDTRVLVAFISGHVGFFQSRTSETPNAALDLDQVPTHSPCRPASFDATLKKLMAVRPDLFEERAAK